MQHISQGNNGGFVSYTILIWSTLLISLWLSLQGIISISYKSMIDEYHLIECQYGLERGTLLCTTPSIFESYKHSITTSGSTKWMIDESGTEKIEAIFYKKDNTTYRIRIFCTHTPTGIHMQHDVLCTVVETNGVIEDIHITEVIG